MIYYLTTNLIEKLDYFSLFYNLYQEMLIKIMKIYFIKLYKNILNISNFNYLFIFFY